MANNMVCFANPQYMSQQETIKAVCTELGLVVYYPNYHGDKNDDNTVIIYTKKGHEFNKTLPYWARSEQEQGYVCHLENTDINGRFDLGWLNRGKVDLRGLDERAKIKAFIQSNLDNYNALISA